ncbi:self-incompatibility protein S1 [Eucalyptus grandis]|uniref:self-incompatibility protein S1 n=1 Tax=Eucalyptus grandis TaxID=71139 RepID=UPI00192EA4D0|nr:self-incompatibility protein S1 [Eucalyptus grandis]
MFSIHEKNGYGPAWLRKKLKHSQGGDMDASTKLRSRGIIFLLLTGSFFALAFSEVHVSVKNRLGSGKNMTLHCQSEDDDLGEQNVADGSEFGWDFNVNVWGTTLFYCDMGWESVQDYQFDAYSFARDLVRCDAQCLWLVSEEGMYGFNGQTGFWEYIYQWPSGLELAKKKL